ncbi:spermidine synthase 3 [Striga asiatica]|uniref:Spermidine synthase 3 n=1 Tax=Striga asiatica TaxID=4170 RepID=A0A5A7PMF9_STRAF|nr:spermidine synthase 3 [Striga asiatica]
MFLASMDAPRRPRLVNPTAYNPHCPFHPFGKGVGDCTLMSPLLILSRVPTSNTGVLPEIFFSSSGPKVGLSSPKRPVSPSNSREATNSKRSTRRMGSHLSSHMDSPKVDFPSISRGRMCT